MREFFNNNSSLAKTEPGGKMVMIGITQNPEA